MTKLDRKLEHLIHQNEIHAGIQPGHVLLSDCLPSQQFNISKNRCKDIG